MLQFFWRVTRLSASSALCLFLLMSVTAFAEDVAKSVEIERFPLACDELIVIPVEVFGEKQQFVLDTGASNAVLDTYYQDRLTVRQQNVAFQSFDGETSTALYVAPEIYVGRLHPRICMSEQSRLCACFDFSVLQERDLPVVGIIGRDFLKSQIIRLNYDENYVAFQNRATLQSSHVEKLRPGMYKNSNIRIQISDEGMHSIVVDTGATAELTLEPKLFESLVKKNRIRLGVSIESQIFSGVRKLRTGILDQVTLGPYTIRNVGVSEAQTQAVGIGFLKRFDTELDYVNSLAYFRPSKYFNVTERWDSAGFALKRTAAGIVVDSLIEGGCGDQAGLANGDIVVQINDQSLQGMKIRQTAEIKRQSPRNLRLTVQRSGQPLQLTVELRGNPQFSANEGQDVGFLRIPD